VSVFTDKIAPAVAELLGRLAEKELAPHRDFVVGDARGRVLEIGAGVGLNLAHYPAGLDALVVSEPSAGLLRRARRRASALGRPVQAVQALAERLPFDDESFETVVSTLVLCSVRDQHRALAEIRRVLRPNGRLLFLEHVRADDARLARWQDRLERPWGLVAMGCHPNRPTLDRIRATGFDVEELRQGELPKAPPIVRPMIAGRAVARS
jgi:SAM-dependent methyltransferase